MGEIESRIKAYKRQMKSYKKYKDPESKVDL